MGDKPVENPMVNDAYWADFEREHEDEDEAYWEAVDREVDRRMNEEWFDY